MFNIRTQERKTMEEILAEDYRGITDTQELDRRLHRDGWRQDRDHEQPITKKQIRRGLRNNAR